METVSNMANLAKSTVLGDNSNNNNNTSSKNSQEQDKVQTDQEPPSGGPPGAGTPQSPFDPGNRPEQEELTGTSTKTGTERTSPTGEEADSVQPITSTFQPAVKTKAGTAKEGSHSALFGLGEGRDEGRKSIHSPPTSDGDSSSTNPAAAAAMAAANQKDAGTDRRGAVGDQVDANGPRDVSSEQSQRNAQIEDDDACGYTGLKKAALEEQEEKKRMGGSDDSTKAQAGSLSSRQNRSVDAIAREEARDPRSMQKNDSIGRDMSPGELPDGTHRSSVANAGSHHHQFKGLHGHSIGHSMDKGSDTSGGGLKDKLKDKLRSKK